MSGQVRMADALLRSVGGRTVLLHISAPAGQADEGEQLGLAAPGFQDVALSPVVFRRVRARLAAGMATSGAEYELLVSASAVETVVGSLAFESAAVLFATACGVLVDGVLYGITSFAEAEAFGVTYLYRLALNGAAKDLV